MQSKYYPPEYKAEEFHCPFCNVYAKQYWTENYASSFPRKTSYKILDVSECQHCKQFSLWRNKKLIVPNNSIAPPPHEDLPEAIVADYQEASSIINNSPRGAAALLRLCLQKLMKELGEPGKNINTDISSLVKKGLPEEVQQALDIVRVVGNESVHPGELDIRDDQETAIQLFELINFIVEEQITRKKKIGAMFAKLPEKKREEIARRDA